MEIIITVAYYFLVRLVFIDYKLLRFTTLWKFIVVGLWCCAAMVEILFLGQYTPYTKSLFATSYVVQMAPEYGGLVREVFIEANEPIKKGDPLFQMDPEPWQYRVNELTAKLTAANTNVAELDQNVEKEKAAVERTRSELEIAKIELQQVTEAAEQNAASRIRVEQLEKQVSSLQGALLEAEASLRIAELSLQSEIGDQHTEVAIVYAELESAKYNLNATTICAPSDGYVVNLALHPGSFVRFKEPVMTFVSTDEYWLVGKLSQKGTQHIKEGDKAEVAFDMYPGYVFEAEVVSLVEGVGNAQRVPSGKIPDAEQITPAEVFAVKIIMKEDHPKTPLVFGATGLAAIYSKDAADILVFLREIEIRVESYLNYLYNPF